MLAPLTTEWRSGSSTRSGVVAIIGSAGGIHALIEILRGLDAKFPLLVLVAQHLSRSAPSLLPAILT